MAETPAVYKRRPRRALSQLDSNALDGGGPESEESPPGSRKPISKLKGIASEGDPEFQVSLLESDENETEPITVSKKNRKSWSDGSASKRRRRRSSTTCGEEFSLKGTASKWTGTPLGRKDKSQGQGSEVTSSDQADKEAVVVKNQPEWLQSPIEYVKEKQAMFAAIDSFELESEEEGIDDKNVDSMEMEGEIPESSKTKSAAKSSSTTEVGASLPESMGSMEMEGEIPESSKTKTAAKSSSTTEVGASLPESMGSMEMEGAIAESSKGKESMGSMEMEGAIAESSKGKESMGSMEMEGAIAESSKGKESMGSMEMEGAIAESSKGKEIMGSMEMEGAIAESSKTKESMGSTEMEGAIAESSERKSAAKSSSTSGVGASQPESEVQS